ncbi:LysR substrate-binding domain-containing protein [Xylophilus sp. GOD-11R]|uniref:LysR substrate-binding domain-containing protein n=1 Tax=Xylophilus sp. GOD-11R TaxID=3089814 RepID=UPI00298CE745|nr:LysR substrate-binding domain-containing protein [Xylophilus sp. GOD-11R]WPB55299.1 LysR substrate-binding domain-containing protein [Xylophilus sp. GOD-11R]
MHLKWLEDFIALAESGNFSRAAELRNVTHPAFGRRIQQLEQWAGTPLVERGRSPARLTAAGALLLESARQMVSGLESSRLELLGEAGRQARTVTIGTGRTLARTVLADWLVRLQPVVRDAQVRVLTLSLADSVQMLERNETDFSLVYHHPALTVRLDGRQFAFVTLASDKLVPVSRADAAGKAVFAMASGEPIPLLAYGRSLAMGRLLEDHLAHNRHAPAVQRRVECDSADALQEYVLKGLGVAWLPWSMVQADCKAGRMALAGDRRMEVRFEVRLYRPKRRLHALGEAVWASAVHR